MALRSIDNALPKLHQGPKKQVKVGVVSIQKQADPCGENNENKAPLPQDVSIDYVSSVNLQALPDPEIKIQILMGGLESKDWVKVCESLNDARRFALFHSNLLLPILEKVILVVVKAMKNPRSALCKTSIMVSSDLFSAFRDGLLEPTDSGAFEQLLLQLLLKASQDKRFVCEEADRALTTMVRFMTPLPLLQKLRAYVGHTNPRIRAKAAVSISQCVSKMGSEWMKDYGLVSLVQTAADMLNDRLPEAREAARSIIVSVFGAVSEHEEHKQNFWQDFCQTNLPPIHVQSIIKIGLTGANGCRYAE